MIRWMTKRIDEILRSTLRNPLEGWLRDLAFGNRSITGKAINHETALGLSGYYAGVRVISEDIAKLPFSAFQMVDDRIREPRRRHPVSLMAKGGPNPDMTWPTFVETLIGHALCFKGGFAEIVRDGAGRPRQLWPLDPKMVSIMSMGGGATIFRVQSNDGRFIDLNQRSIFHIHGLGLDGMTSYVISQFAKNSIGLGLGALETSGAFFANGMRPSVVVEMANRLSDKAEQVFREGFTARYSSSKNAQKAIFLKPGMKLHVTNTSPSDSQMIETMQFSIEEAARLLRVAPHKLQHLLRSTNNNIETQSREHVGDALMPWARRFEAESNRKLFLPGEQENGFFVKFNFEALLRGDMNAQGQWFERLHRMGVYSINTILEKLDENPIANGDVRFINSASITLEAAIARSTSETQKVNQDDDDETEAQNVANGQDEANDGDQVADRHADNAVADAMDQVTETHRTLFDIAYKRLLRVEADKIRRRRSKSDFRTWSTEFREQEVDHIIATLGPPVDSFVAALGVALGFDTAVPLAQELGHHATRHLAETHLEGPVLDLLAGRSPNTDTYVLWAVDDAIQTIAMVLQAAIELPVVRGSTIGSSAA